MCPSPQISSIWPVLLAKVGLAMFCLALALLLVLSLATGQAPHDAYPLLNEALSGLALAGASVFVSGSLLAPLVAWFRERKAATRAKSL